MTLPASGAISMSQVNTELGLSSTATISLNDSAVRTLFGKGSGAIAMSDGYGKANQFAFTVSSNTANLDVRAAAVAAGWNGTSKVICTINSGVYVYSNSTGSYACTISGSFPNGVQLINSGVIVGRGGNGGNGGNSGSGTGGTAGAAGGPALYASTAVTIQNNGSINGGGGGGGGGPYNYFSKAIGGYLNSGGGGGGGIGISSGGSPGTSSYGFPASAGTAGTLTAAGPGGAGGNRDNTAESGRGGAGGGYGSAGSASVGSFKAGGGGGAAVVGNANISWAATGTRNGSIS